MDNSRFSYQDSRRISHLMSDRIDPHAVLTSEIGPAYQEYRLRWEAARAYRDQPDFPIQVDYEMKFTCNLRCPMCLMSLPLEERRAYGRPAVELGPETVSDLLKEGAERGQCALGFGGLWEPLLSPEVPEIVARARALGLVDAMFNTNGLLLTEKTGRALIKAGLTKLMVSLDAATPETYAIMRPGSDFGTVVANVENFLALRKRLGRVLPLVRLSFCRTAVNAHELPAFWERWEGKVDFFSLQTYGRYLSGDTPGFPPDQPEPLPPGRCAQPHKRLLVRHNGQVLPCCDASSTALVLGDIHTASLADIWQGPALAALRERLAAADLSGPAAPCRACQTKFAD